MSVVIEEASESLKTLAQEIKKQAKEEKLLVEAVGWNLPALYFEDLAEKSKALAEKIEELNEENLTEETKELLDSIAPRVSKIVTHTIPQLPAANSVQAFPAIFIFLAWIESRLLRLFVVADLENPEVVSFDLSRRYRALRAQFDELEISREGLGEKIDAIESAYDAAKSLPADMQSLADTREKIEADAANSARASALAEKYREQLESHLTVIKEQRNTADSVVERAEEAYRIATTTGLAGAFEERAKKLAQSTWVWTVGLILSLAAGIFIGSDRLQSLSESLEKAPSNTIVVIQFVLSIIGLGAPIWFAWISTKQIGQRFRLAEDYAFKASVAKAYEGYRKEATRLDESFESRLFGSTLDRIEEEPLRLIESGVHSSPLAEILASKRLEASIENDPSVRDNLRSLVRKLDQREQAKMPKTDNKIDDGDKPEE